MDNINPKTGKPYKTSVAQREANKRSRAKNPESTNAKQYRTAKSYMNKHANEYELREVLDLVEKRLKNFCENHWHITLCDIQLIHKVE